jgi:hypothetical protein
MRRRPARANRAAWILPVVAVLMPLWAIHSAAPAAAAPVYPGGGVFGFGNAVVYGPAINATLNSVMVTMAPTPDGGGYWLAAADGGIYAEGNAHFYGSTGNLQLQGPLITMAATSDGGGYWLAALDGGIFSFGDARFYGSMGGTPLNQPIVGMTPTPDGKGYWLVAADGGIFSFGDARFLGSTGSLKLDQPIVGMAASPSGNGYWLVAADGGIFTFGDALFSGSMAGQPLNPSDKSNASVAGMAVTPDGRGYWIAATDGAVFPLGDAQNYGGIVDTGDATPISAIVRTPNGQGYWLLDPDGFAYSFANPPPTGSFRGAATVVAAVASQVGPDPLEDAYGDYCNYYGPCEQWCSLFVTWAWQQAGYSIPSFPAVVQVYDWGFESGVVLPGTAMPKPGYANLYYDPDNGFVHMAIVVQVWPDGAVVTVDGDSGPGYDGQLAVTVNGPFLPALQGVYGDAIVAYVAPR